jgi:hypothetical protein
MILTCSRMALSRPHLQGQRGARGSAMDVDLGLRPSHARNRDDCLREKLAAGVNGTKKPGRGNSRAEVLTTG